MNEPTDEPRPLLASARDASDNYLFGKVMDGAMTPDTARDMALTGFTRVTRDLSEMHTQGMSEDCITQMYEDKRDEAEAAGNERRVIAAEYTLAVWKGMRADLAAYLRGTETER